MDEKLNNIYPLINTVRLVKSGENKLDKAGNTHGRNEAYATEIYFEYLVEQYHLEGLGVDKGLY